MTGLRIPLPDTTFTGSSPILPEIDPVVPPTGGLLLIEANHPLGGFPSGVPTNGVAITNLLREPAAELLGVAASTLDPLQAVVNMTSTYGKVEKTTLGGIHAIQSTTQTANTEGFQIRFPPNILTYMKANASHTYYLSMWHMPTRLISPEPSVSAFSQLAYPGGYFYVMGSGLGAESAGMQNARTRGTLDTPMCSVQAISDSAAGWTGTAADYALVWNGMFEVGNFGPINRGANGGKHGARVVWRIYMEDLSVSGRSYATVVALDNIEFARQVTTSGGRYYGDTVVTDPDTFT